MIDASDTMEYPPEYSDVLYRFDRLIEQNDSIIEQLRLQTRLLGAIRRSVAKPLVTHLDFPFTPRMRVRGRYLVLAVSEATTVTVEYGTDIHLSYEFSVGGTFTYPIDKIIEPGVDCSLTTTTGSASGYIIAEIV